MPPVVRALAPSEAKSRFIEHLKLDQPGRQHLYALMKAEAVEAWQRLQLDRNALLLNLQRSNAQPPYSNSQISETAMHREIINIYQDASPETRACYELAHDTTGNIEAENWIIRWCLWHVFRDRDQRKKSRSCAQAAGEKVETARHAVETTTSTNSSSSSTNGSSLVMHQRHGIGIELVAGRAVRDRLDRKPVILPYDPVRDC